MEISKQAIVAEARKWIGTPFEKRGRERGRGVDCVGLPLCILRDLEIVDWTERFKIYPDQPMTPRVLEICLELLEQKSPEDMEPGDLIVLRLPSVACHVAIVADGEVDGCPHMIHGYAGGPKRVVEHLIDERWKRRIAACFELPLETKETR